MKNPEEHQLEFWERAAITAASAILATETGCTVEEASEMATDCADRLLVAWRSRFGQAAGMTSTDYEAEGTADPGV
jgi:hypothetical protein